MQAEIVTADGKVLIANQCQNQDIFWAIRGGGGSTFGVVTKMTYMTHELPNNFGALTGTITAVNDQAYQKLIKQFLIFFRQSLNNEHWGEQVSFTPNNKMQFALVFVDLDEPAILKVLKPFITWLKKYPDQYTIDLDVKSVAADKLWDYAYFEKGIPGLMTLNTINDSNKNQFWWASNSQEVSAYWYTYQSRWLPLQLFSSGNIDKTAKMFYQASRIASYNLHINKGLAGGNTEALKRSKQTSTHPSAFDAAALVIAAAATNSAYPNIKNHEPNKEEAKKEIEKINRVMSYFIKLAPNAGAYANEADYFQPNWQQAFWGANYSKLLSIKKKYDPQGLFYCHHCVGSEGWTSDGMCRE